MKNPSEKKSTIQRFLNALNIKTPQQKLFVAIKDFNIRDLNIEGVNQAIKDGANIHKKYSIANQDKVYPIFEK